jgi:hypothetical protein
MFWPVDAVHGAVDLAPCFSEGCTRLIFWILYILHVIILTLLYNLTYFVGPIKAWWIMYV